MIANKTLPFCYNCDRYGHSFEFCDQPINYCLICNAGGHTMKYHEPLSKVCYRCSKSGYYITNCQKHGPTRKAGGILFNKDMTKVVCILNKWHWPNKWGFPKGGVKNGETLREGAIREILEETGIRIRFNECQHGIKIGRTVYFTGVVEAKLKVPDNTEVIDIKWIKLDDLLKYPINYELKTFALRYMTRSRRTKKIRRIRKLLTKIKLSSKSKSKSESKSKSKSKSKSESESESKSKSKS